MQDFNKKNDIYQRKIAQKMRGILINKALKNLTGEVPTNQQITYVYALLKVRNQKAQDNEPNDYFPIPVEYLFCLMTYCSAKDYDKTKHKKYMASVTQQSIDPLSKFITVTKYDEGYCRRFMIGNELMSEIKQELMYLIEGKDELDLNFTKPNVDVGLKPASWGVRKGSLRSNELPEITKKAWEKLKKSRFVFDLQTYESRQGKEFNRTLFSEDPKERSDQHEALSAALDDINWSNKPQYHSSFYIQGPGRLHTSGGPMAMMTPFRKHYIKPVSPSNVILEMDLKCAQLLILCDILGASSVKEQILTIINNESIWLHIGPESLPKAVKKVISYGFCFGAKMEELPFLATQKAKKKLGHKYSVTKEIVNSCFEGILKPLVELRDQWLINYSIEKIDAGQVDKIIHTNVLGLKFSLNKECEKYLKEKPKGQANNLKIGAKLLAHYAQGKEQLIIQKMIGEQIEENILTYSYDGITIEVEPTQSEEVKNRLNTWMAKEFPGFILEFENYI